MKRRFECRKCGRRGQYGSFKNRTTFAWLRGWQRRILDLFGDGECRNTAACNRRSA